MEYSFFTSPSTNTINKTNIVKAGRQAKLA